MKTSQQGMILLFTLLLLSLISGFILLELEMLLLQQKTVQQFIGQQQLKQTMSSIAARLIKAPPLTCIVSGQANPNTVLTQLTDTKACQLIEEKHLFHYVIEDLGLFACVQINTKKTISSSHHWRLSIQQLDTLDNNESNPLKKPQHTLQIRFATIGPYQLCENNQTTVIQAGITSWRVIE